MMDEYGTLLPKPSISELAFQIQIDANIHKALKFGTKDASHPFYTNRALYWVYESEKCPYVTRPRSLLDFDGCCSSLDF
mgnify:CR=1 FL=1